jgi:hypothetical protein
MSTLSKTIVALGFTAALVGGALAQSGGGEPWVLRSNMGYVVDMKGNYMVIDLDKLDSKKRVKATEVSKGTVFYMQNGKLMMADWPTGQ